MEGDKFVQVQKWDGKETKFVREIKDGKMVMVSLISNAVFTWWLNELVYVVSSSSWINVWFPDSVPDVQYTIFKTEMKSHLKKISD